MKVITLSPNLELNKSFLILPISLIKYTKNSREIHYKISILTLKPRNWRSYRDLAILHKDICVKRHDQYANCKAID